MSRVSVAEGSKPKPKASFKFLRRDEGRLSYAVGATAESPSRSTGTANGSDGDKIHRERRDSKSLREAIAFDMRNAKSHDPLGEVVVAVPRRAPPPNRAASTPPPQPSSASNNSYTGTGSRQESSVSSQKQTQQRRAPANAAAKKRPEWVNPEIPAAPVRAASAAAVAPDYDAPRSFCFPATEDADGGAPDFGRYGGHTPRRAGIGAPVPRYVDAADYDNGSAAHSSSAVDRNYFRRPPSQQPQPSTTSSRGREEEDLMLSLEQEIRAAQEEREHYASARQQLDLEKQRFETYRFNAQQQLDDERFNADGQRARDQRDAQKDLRSIEERHKSVSALLVTEREANRRLSQENDSLRAQLEDLTYTLRETQQTHKTEVARMRRDIDSLTRRNAELLAMAKEQQLSVLGDNNNSSSINSEKSAKNASTPAVRRASATAAAAGSRNASATRDRSSVAPVPSLDTGELTTPDRRSGTSGVPAVMDFTPRANAGEEAARERRNRQMQERIQAERAEMEERKRLREAETAEKRRVEEEKRKLREQQGRETREREASTASATAATSKPVEERKAAGHPINTPRVQSGAAAAAVRKRSAAAASHPPVPPKSSRVAVPTREELLGDVEPPPSEDFPSDSPVSQTALGDNPSKKETLYRSGKREIHYANGTVKAVLPSGHTILHFTNGDVKCTFPSGKSTYWYDAAQTMHTQMPDGVQTFEFRTTGQVERHMPDGGKSILYPDGIYKVVRGDGTEETFYPDGELMEE